MVSTSGWTVLSKFTFLFDMRPVPYCSFYKYLGVNINEFLDFQFTVNKHSESAGRALSAIITKMIKNNGFPFNVYTLLYNTCVTSVSDYSAAVTGYTQYDSTLQIHLRAIRAFLGVPKNACNVGVLSEVSWVLPQYRTKMQVVRQYHRLINMADTRLANQILLWDKALNDQKIVSTWSNEVKNIFDSCNLSLCFEHNFNLQDVISSMKAAFIPQQNQYLKAECQAKPKLRTFILFKNFDSEPAYTTKPLSFFQRRMMAKLRLGCLPIRLETGRYSIPRLPENERTCLVCKDSLLVDIPAGAGPALAGGDLTDGGLAGGDLADGGLAGVNRAPVESEAHFFFVNPTKQNENFGLQK
jgi:hypothetical protein